MLRRFHLIAERLEQSAKKCFAAAARNRRETRLEWQLGRRQLRLPFAPTAERGVEPPCENHPQERRRYVRTIVDVLVLGAALPPAPAHHCDRIHIEQYGRRAGIFRGLRVEDRGVAEWEFARVDGPGACAGGNRGRLPVDGSFEWLGALSCRNRYLDRTCSVSPKRRLGRENR